MKPLVEFIIPTYDRIEPLRCMLSSLKAQTLGNWGAHVMIDNPYDVKNIELVNSFMDSRIKYTVMEERFNDWGHTPRERGKQMSNAQYVIMTGDDNYYTPNFVHELHYMSQWRPGMIYWDMIHSHYNYHYFKCSPGYNQIDMGAFATRIDLAKQIFLGIDYAADGIFVEKFKTMFSHEAILRIDRVLFVHN